MQQTIAVNDRLAVSHVGTTPQTVFGVDFPFFSLNDVLVTVQADGSNAVTTLVRGADYSLIGVATEDGSFSSGVVTLTLPITNTTLTRTGVTPIERLSNFPLQGFFSRLALNAELNRITVVDQEHTRELGLRATTQKALQIPDYGNQMAAIVDSRKSKVLAWSADGGLTHSNQTLADIENGSVVVYTGSTIDAVAPTLATMRTLISNPGPKPSTVLMQGYYAPGDGGGGPVFDYLTGSLETDDGFMVIKPDDISGAAPGRYVRHVQFGAAVCIVWAGCGLGQADDTSQLAKVAVYASAKGKAVNMDCPLPLKIGSAGVTFPLGGTCPGIFSNGNCLVVESSTATSATVAITVRTRTFFVHGIKAVLPASTNPAVVPLYDRFLSFVDPLDVSVTECGQQGGWRGLWFSPSSSDPSNVGHIYIDSCTLTDIFGDTIFIEACKSALISNNRFERNAVNGTYSSAGGMRINNGSGSEVTGIICMIIGNRFLNCASISGQDGGIDMSGTAFRDALVANNMCDCPGSAGFVELKSTPTTGSPENVYRNYVFVGNLIHNPSNYAFSCFTLNNGNAVPAGKMANVSILANTVYGDIMNTIGGQLVYINGGWSNVVVASNVCDNIYSGVAANPSGPAIGIVLGGVEAIGNSMRCYHACFQTNAGTVTPVRLIGNRMISAVLPPLKLDGATVSDLDAQGNYFEVQTAAQACCELRNVTGILVYNRFRQSANGPCVVIPNVGTPSLRMSENTFEPGTNVAVQIDHAAAAGVEISRNYALVINGQPVIGGTGAGWLAHSNMRPGQAANPNGVCRGGYGEIVPVLAPVAGGAAVWHCTTPGATVGATVWKAINLQP